MKLYHGSSVEMDRVDLQKCRPYKDFGRGFYTTVSEEPAWGFARCRVKQSGGNPVVTVFEVPDDLLQKENLSVRVFDEKPSVEWVMFVTNNRSREITDYESLDCNLDGKYDVVAGPVANDDVGMAIRLFTRGIIMERRLKDYLDSGILPTQYTFHTEKALGYLKKVGVLYDG